MGVKANDTAKKAHTGRFAANLAYGTAESSLRQTVAITSGQNYQFHVSLSTSTDLNSPTIYVQVLYENTAGEVVGVGLEEEIVYGNIPGGTSDAWLNILQITELAPATATQASVIISKPISALNAPIVYVDDVALVEFSGGDGTGATGPTGVTGVTGATGASGATEIGRAHV